MRLVMGVLNFHDVTFGAVDLRGADECHLELRCEGARGCDPRPSWRAQHVAERKELRDELPGIGKVP